MARFVLSLAVLAVAFGTAAQAQNGGKPKVLPVIAPPTTPDNGPRLGVIISARPTGGAVIHNVLAGFPAQDIGLEAGDVILAVNGAAVNRVGDVGAGIDHALAAHGGQLVLLVQDVRGTGLVQLSTTIQVIEVHAYAKTVNGMAAPAQKMLKAGPVTKTRVK